MPNFTKLTGGRALRLPPSLNLNVEPRSTMRGCTVTFSVTWQVSLVGRVSWRVTCRSTALAPMALATVTVPDDGAGAGAGAGAAAAADSAS